MSLSGKWPNRNTQSTPLADQINPAIALTHVDLDIRIFREETRQVRQQEVTCQRALHLQSHQPFRLGAAERAFGVFEIGDQ